MIQTLVKKHSIYLILNIYKNSKSKKYQTNYGLYGCEGKDHSSLKGCAICIVYDNITGSIIPSFSYFNI